jgi:hypothetical protein
MQPLIDHARAHGQRPEESARPAAGRSPRVPFTTCPGARAVPAPHSCPCVQQHLTQSRPRLRGPYFEVRTGAVREHRTPTGPFEALRGAR